MKEYEIHEACAIFPECSAEDSQALLESVKKDGLLEPIKLYKGKILDGRSRYSACKNAGVEPRFENCNPDDPVAAVLAWNLARRHLSASQKAMVAAEASKLSAPAAKARMLAGVSIPSGEARGKSVEFSAKAVGVSPQSVERAAKVIAKGDPTLIAAVKADEVKVSDAAKIVDQPKAKQAAAVKDVQEGKAKTVAAAVAPKKKPPKQGKVVGNFAAVKEALEKITRAADDLNRERSGGKFHREFLNGIEACHTALKAWQRAAR